jgi:hypothetical protein
MYRRDNRKCHLKDIESLKKSQVIKKKNRMNASERQAYRHEKKRRWNAF